MNTILLRSFDNYIEAHLVMGRVLDAGIKCWLLDENTVTINPFLAGSVGGIKLMVGDKDYEAAMRLLENYDGERRKWFSCPGCGSNNIEQITIKRKGPGWMNKAVSWILGSDAIAADKTWHCHDCNTDFDMPAFEMPGQGESTD